MRTASRIQLQSHGWLFPLSGMHYRGVLLLIVGCWLALPSFGQTASAEVSAAPGQFKQALSGVQPNSLSIEELQLLTQAMISQNQLGDHWSDMLVWRFRNVRDPIPPQNRFLMFSQGISWRRLRLGDKPEPALLPAYGLTSIVSGKGANMKTNIETYHQVAAQNFAGIGSDHEAAAKVVLNLAGRLINTQAPTPPALPPVGTFAPQNLWVWQMVLEELENQPQSKAKSWVTKLKMRGNTTIVGNWSDLVGNLSAGQPLGQPERISSSGGSPDTVFRAIQQHKSQFLRNTQSESPATAAQIQSIVRQDSTSNPHIAIEFCRSTGGYLAVAFIRISGRNNCKVLVQESTSMSGLLGQLSSDLGGSAVSKKVIVVLGIDCHFEPGDYTALDQVFSLSRDKCYLCPSLSVMARLDDSAWDLDVALRYLHYSQDFDLQDIGSAAPVKYLSGLSGTKVKPRQIGRDVLMIHSL
jgi:hypothetical protein